MGVGDGKVSILVICVCYCILRTIKGYLSIRLSGFFYTVSDLLAVCLFIKVRPGMGPPVGLIQGYLLSGRVSVSIKLYLYPFRSLSILVVSIRPYLAHADAGLSRIVGVLDVVCSISLGCHIVFYSILHHGIRDLGSCTIFWKVLKLPFPASFRSYLFTIFLYPVRFQVDRDLLRPCAFVSGIVPDFFAFDVNQLLFLINK